MLRWETRKILEKVVELKIRLPKLVCLSLDTPHIVWIFLQQIYRTPSLIPEVARIYYREDYPLNARDVSYFRNTINEGITCITENLELRGLLLVPSTKVLGEKF